MKNSLIFLLMPQSPIHKIMKVVTIIDHDCWLRQNLVTNIFVFHNYQWFLITHFNWQAHTFLNSKHFVFPLIFLLICDSDISYTSTNINTLYREDGDSKLKVGRTTTNEIPFDVSSSLSPTTSSSSPSTTISCPYLFLLHPTSLSTLISFIGWYDGKMLYRVYSYLL
jgi:hypothetical protein